MNQSVIKLHSMKFDTLKIGIAKDYLCDLINATFRMYQ